MVLEALNESGIAIIPGRANRKKLPFLDPFVYALHNQIERCFNKLKNAKLLATQYDKTAKTILASFTSYQQGFGSNSLSTELR
jgi:hypothetical protein